MSVRTASIVEIWRELCHGLDIIYKAQDKLPPTRYMELYT